MISVCRPVQLCAISCSCDSRVRTRAHSIHGRKDLFLIPPQPFFRLPLSKLDHDNNLEGERENLCIDSRWIRAMVKAREPRRPTFLPFRPLIVHPLIPRQLGWRATKWPRVSSVGFARAARGTALHRFWTCSCSRGGILLVGGGNGCLVFCEILDLMQMAGYGCWSIFLCCSF